MLNLNLSLDRIPIVLNEVIPEAPDTYTFRFSEVQGLHWEAGANAHLVAGDITTFNAADKSMRRHMSIMSGPREGYIGFTTRIREPRSLFKTSLMKSRPGDTLQMYGIKNNFPLVREGRPLVLLSMGVGMATMRPLIREYMSMPEGIPQLVSINVDRAGKGVYQEEMEALRIPGFSQHYVKGRKDFQSRVEESLKFGDALYFLVGSDEFLVQTAAFLHHRGVAKSRLKIDKKAPKVRAILEAL